MDELYAELHALYEQRAIAEDLGLMDAFAALGARIEELKRRLEQQQEEELTSVA